MAELMIIADDFTGGLDTGVQFAKQGIATCVLTEKDTDLAGVDKETQVLVMVLETRHLPAQEAYRMVYDTVRAARDAGIGNIYKKTDSALRGNIGAELSAVRDALGCAVLPFVPAFPKMNRVTRDGVHYIDGVRAAESVFGRDPFEPVRESDVARLIALQSDTAVMNMAVSDEVPRGEGILVCDAGSDGDLVLVGEKLKAAGLIGASAGCAGFGGVLRQLLGLKETRERALPKPEGGLFVLCGSVNPITLRQLDHGEKNGFLRVHIPAEQKLGEGFFDSEAGEEQARAWRDLARRTPWFILDANDEIRGGEPLNADSRRFAEAHGMDTERVRRVISASLGRVMRSILPGWDRGVFLITGGDTLLECMRDAGVDRMEPVCELVPGVVLAAFRLGDARQYVIAKSGGFGKETLLTDLRDRILSGRWN